MGVGKHRIPPGVLAAVATFAFASPRIALAGMPSLTLTDIAAARVETISFFVMVLLVSSWFVKLLWNGLRRDFSRLPKLTYPRALCLVTLWGFLFALVLTMISGARELLTPGAWERDGATYRLTAAADREAFRQLQTQRAAHLESLKVALWNYAALHDGNLPANAWDPQIAADFWETPDPSRTRYVYIPGRKASVGSNPVAFEPMHSFPSPRWVLLSDGRVMQMHDSEIRAATQEAGER